MNMLWSFAIKKHFFVWGMFFLTFPLYAQQFSVQRFRLLPNDISAYIQPVKDLNEEACALIKVMGNRDFVFSTPLGIVKRINDVGEIWIYVPQGTVLITIKHPQWGVLRDYRLSLPVESRLTYELVLNFPILMPQRTIPPLIGNIAEHGFTFGCPSQLLMQAWIRPKRPREKLSYLMMADVSVYKRETAGGIRLGVMKRHGAYLHVLSNFQPTPDTHGMECDENGIPEGGSTPLYYTGKTENLRYAFLLGGIHRIIGRFYLYEGMGYGARTVVWETNEGNYIRNKSYSTKGLSVEFGGVLRWKKAAFSFGALTTAGRHWELNTGIGVCL